MTMTITMTMIMAVTMIMAMAMTITTTVFGIPVNCGIVLSITELSQNSSKYKSELLKRTDTQAHARAKFSRICAKFIFLNAELAKQALFHIFGTI